MWAACSGLHQPGQSDDPVQSLKRTSLALVAAAIDRALAMAAAAIPEPTVNATQPRQAVPVRTASAERSDLGGGFIEFFVRRSASARSALSGATDLPVLAVLLRAAAAFGTMRRPPWQRGRDRCLRSRERRDRSYRALIAGRALQKENGRLSKAAGSNLPDFGGQA